VSPFPSRPSRPSSGPARRPSPLTRFRLVSTPPPRGSSQPAEAAPAPASPGDEPPHARSRTPEVTGVQPRAGRWRDFDLVVALGALWAVSIVRVAGAAHRHEVFGAEATLAFICMFAIPWLMVKARVARGPVVDDARVEHAPGHAPLRLVK
jgi:hypothetical protein